MTREKCTADTNWGAEHGGSRYIGFCVLDGSEAVLVTDKQLCVHCFNTHKVVWQVQVGAVQDVNVADRSSKPACSAPHPQRLSSFLARV